LLLQDEAFRMVRGIPRMMTYDNMTTVGWHVAADEVWLNVRFEAYRRSAAFRYGSSIQASSVVAVHVLRDGRHQRQVLPEHEHAFCRLTMQRILELADRYGSSRVAGAAAHAARYGNCSAETVARVHTGGALRRRSASHADRAGTPLARGHGRRVERSGRQRPAHRWARAARGRSGRGRGGGAGEPEADATPGAGGSDDGGGGGGGGDGDAGSDVEEG
jgi:uncharacterized membrane protein YgcG